MSLLIIGVRMFLFQSAITRYLESDKEYDHLMMVPYTTVSIRYNAVLGIRRRWNKWGNHRNRAKFQSAITRYLESDLRQFIGGNLDRLSFNPL